MQSKAYKGNDVHVCGSEARRGKKISNGGAKARFRVLAEVKKLNLKKFKVKKNGLILLSLP